MKQKNRILSWAFLAMLLLSWQEVFAQKTCVIASAEDHVPLREALIHTNNNHWARTDYRGYWTMRYQFDSATVSKPGFVKATIRYKELPDTVFLLPEAKQIGEVTVWGKNQEHVEQMEQQIQDKVNSLPTSPGGIGFDAFGWMDKQGRRDRKHKEQAQKIFKQMDKKDPIVSAYEQATGKTYELKNPFDISGKADGKADREFDGKADGKFDGKADGKANGKFDGKADGKADREFDGKTDGNEEKSTLDAKESESKSTPNAAESSEKSALSVKNNEKAEESEK